MANKKITELAAAAALTGAELVEAVQGGTNVQTTAQDIANLGVAGGGVTSVNGDAGPTVSLIASEIPFTPVGTIAATDVQAAIAEVAAEAGGGAVDSVNGQTGVVVLNASNIANTPAGGIAATTVQAAINELDTEKVSLANTATALTDGASITITGQKHTLTTDESTITFSQSYTGDLTYISVTFNTTAATWTFPAGSLCVVEGSASGDNTATIAATSGDKVIISILFVTSGVYRVVIKNFGQ